MRNNFVSTLTDTGCSNGSVMRAYTPLGSSTEVLERGQSIMVFSHGTYYAWCVSLGFSSGRVSYPETNRGNALVYGSFTYEAACWNQAGGLDPKTEGSVGLSLMDYIRLEEVEDKLLSKSEIELCKKEAAYEPASEWLKKHKPRNWQEKKKPTLKKKSKK